MILYKQPEVMHYFNAQTAVSIELPFSWIEIKGGTREAVYVYEIDEEEQNAFAFQPQLVVKRFDLPAVLPNAAAYFSDELIAVSQPEQIVEKQEDIMIDGVAGKQVQLTYLMTKINQSIVQIQFFLPVEQALVSITGLVAKRDAERFLPDMQTAVNSIRIL